MLALRQKTPERSMLNNIVTTLAPMAARAAGQALGQLMRQGPGNVIRQALGNSRNEKQQMTVARKRTRRSSRGAASAGGPQYGTAFRVASVAAPAVAYGSNIAVGPGLSNFRFRLAYAAGTVHVGNGTLGATGQIYFFVPGGNAFASGYVPVAPADATWGRSYIKDVVKHYTRRIYHRIVLHYVPIGGGASSTSALTVGFAPIIGGSGAAAGYLSDTTAAAYSISDTLGMAGGMAKPSWEGWAYDLTRWIRGGSGPKQNEFSSATTANLSVSTTSAELRDIIPCNYVFTGQTTGISNYYGQDIGLVYITLDVELLDFAQLSWGFTPELKRKVEREQQSDQPSLVDAISDEKTSDETKHSVADIRSTVPTGKSNLPERQVDLSTASMDAFDVGAAGPPPRSQTPSQRPSVQRTVSGGPLPSPSGPTARVQLSTR